MREPKEAAGVDLPKRCSALSVGAAIKKPLGFEAKEAKPDEAGA
jgi:hypothetical protein